MQRSFKDRLAALERLEASADADAEQRAAADALTDDQVLEEALAAMTDRCMGYNTWSSMDDEQRAMFRADVAADRVFWQRIAERADAIRQERGVLLIPAGAEELRDFLARFEAGGLSMETWAGPERVWTTQGLKGDTHDAICRFQWILDQVRGQGVGLEGDAAVIAWLREHVSTVKPSKATVRL